MANNRVSVIIPSRNRPALLQRAVDSVSAQTHSNVEVVVFDNCSDHPIDPDRLNSRFPLQVLRSEKPHRKPIVLNLALHSCTGDFISYLDDDDEILADKFADQLSAFAKYPEVEMVYSDTRQCLHDGTTIVSSGPPSLEAYLRHAHSHPNAIMLRRRTLETISFDERMTTYEDIMFIAQVLKHHQVHHIEKIHAVWYRDGRPDQLTKRNYRRSYENRKRLCERFATEIDDSTLLRRFYHRKMLLLSLMFLDIPQALHSLKALSSRTGRAI
jgi:glycosyltransferase involved in cell wall biosynthesis